MTDITNNLISLPPTAVALGFFDGLHLGHMQVVNETFRHSSLASAMFTFHSDTQLPKRQKVENLLSNDMKLEKLDKSGIQYVYSPDFETVSHYTTEDFVAKVLIKIMNAKLVVCGFDFRLGSDGGDSEKLKSVCEGYGIEVVVIPPFALDGCIVHSTAIKNHIKNGEINKANTLLGYDFGYEATVIRGRRLGTELDIPTINQIYPENIVVPKFGVYKSMTLIGDRPRLSVTNIGVRPTVDNGNTVPVSETHIIDFDGDLYDRNMRVFLLDFVRPERKFSNFSELKSQLMKDRKAVKR